MFCSNENKPHHGHVSHHCHGDRPAAPWWAHQHHGHQHQHHHHHHKHHEHHNHHFNGVLWGPTPQHSRHHGHCHSHQQHGHSKPMCFFRGKPVNENLHGIQKKFDYSENYN